MVSKKIIEKNCLKKTQAYIPYANKHSKYVLNLLNGEVIESERPDFLIKNDKETIGVEHFLIDTLIGEKKASRSRLRQSEINRTFNRFHDDLDGNEEKALRSIESIVQADVDAVQKFDYGKFIKEFERIVNDHVSKVGDYKKIQGTSFKTMFLIEIPIAKNKMIGINRKFDKEIIKGRRFPITDEMLRILRRISADVDYIVISSMHENYKTISFAVYTFDCKCFEESIAPQVNDIYYKFTYDWQLSPIKAVVELNLEESKNI